MTAIRVLLVDDNPEFQEAASQFVAMETRLEVVGQAYSGLQALELAAQLDPDLVLMDFMLPDMNGGEATGLLKAQRPHTYVVILTLHDIPEYRSLAQVAGADGFLAKADFGKELIPLVINLMDNGSGEATQGQEARTQAPEVTGDDFPFDSQDAPGLMSHD